MDKENNESMTILEYKYSNDGLLCNISEQTGLVIYSYQWK